MNRFSELGVIKNEAIYDEERLCFFTEAIRTMREKVNWSRNELINLFNQVIPEFNHKETGKFLDGRM
jgi:hypothetical protein